MITETKPNFDHWMNQQASDEYEAAWRKHRQHPCSDYMNKSANYHFACGYAAGVARTVEWCRTFLSRYGALD